MERLQDIEYAKFKEYVYEIYLKNIYEPNTNIIDEQRILVHNKFNSRQIDKIYNTTIAFPFDVELFNCLIGIKINSENIDRVANKFKIPAELVVSKIKEYAVYPIDNINGQGLINKDYILELSRLFVSRNEEKNNKSVDF